MEKTTRKIVLSGLLIALSIVLTRLFGINLPLPGFAGVTGFRITIGAVPIILAGIVLGPVWGFAVGAIADFVGFFIVYGGMPNPLITLVSALTGLLPWFFMKLAKRLDLKWRLIVSITVTQIVCALIFQTGALALLYAFMMKFSVIQAFQALFVYRVLFVLATIPVFFIILYYTLIGLRKAKLLTDIV